METNAIEGRNRTASIPKRIIINDAKYYLQT
jgi:hypothetical protein